MTDEVGTMEDVMVAGRDYMPGVDDAFIYSTWRNGLYYGHLSKSDLPPAEEFFAAQTRKIKDFLNYASIRMACIKDAPDVILGYAVFTGDLHLEWIFVKQQFRGKGIGNFLTVKMKSVSPELTKTGAAIVKKKNLVIKES